MELLKSIEKNIDNNFSLFDTIISDRRIFFGKNSSFFQDYERRYNDDQLYSLIFNYYKLIDNFIEKLNPDVLVNFLPVNLFDYISYLICKKKKYKNQ